MKKQFLLIGTLCLIYGSLSAQQPNPKLKDYPPGVIIKVHEVLKKAPLPETAQLKLAAHFLQEEKELSAAVLKGEKEESLNRLKFKYTESLNDILKASGQLGNYYKLEKNDQAKYHRDSLLIREGVKTTGGVYNTVFTMRDKLKLTTKQQEMLYGTATKNERLFLCC